MFYVFKTPAMNRKGLTYSYPNSQKKAFLLFSFFLFFSPLFSYSFALWSRITPYGAWVILMGTKKGLTESAKCTSRPLPIVLSLGPAKLVLARKQFTAKAILRKFHNGNIITLNFWSNSSFGHRNLPSERLHKISVAKIILISQDSNFSSINPSTPWD